MSQKGYEFCFYQLQKPFLAGSIETDGIWRQSLIGYDNVPCIVQCRFDGLVPASGDIYIATGLWDGRAVRTGNLIRAAAFGAVALDYSAGIESGFSIELEQGVGREILIYNDLDVQIDNVVVWIAKKTSTSVEESNVKGRL